LISLSGHPIIVLKTTVTLIGRDPACDVRIGSSRVSRCHCCVVLESDEVVVRDLNSTNGTRINGATIGTGRLRDGDEIEIAHLRYRLRVEGPARGQTVAPDVGSPERSPLSDVPAESLETRLQLEFEAGADRPASPP
jgi:pSer/pThr/pTyr-binding forkhead associated (FHA) protein